MGCLSAWCHFYMSMLLAVFVLYLLVPLSVWAQPSAIPPSVSVGSDIASLLTQPEVVQNNGTGTVLLYNVGLAGVLRTLPTVSLGLGSLSSSASDINTYFRLQSRSCSFQSQVGNCSKSFFSTAPLSQQPLAIQLPSLSTACSNLASPAYLRFPAVFNGSVLAGTDVHPNCDGGSLSNIAFTFNEYDVSNTVFNIQSWNAANGSLCVQASMNPMTQQVNLTLAYCNVTELNQRWAVYGVHLPNTLPLAETMPGGGFYNVLMYNLGLSAVVTPLSTGLVSGLQLTDLNSAMLGGVAYSRLLPADCPASQILYDYCTFSAYGNASSPSQLIAIRTSTNCDNAQNTQLFNVENGITFTTPNNPLEYYCDSRVANNEVFQFIPVASPNGVANVFLLQGWYNRQGVVCVSAAGYSKTDITLQLCDATDTQQLWAIVAPGATPTPPATPPPPTTATTTASPTSHSTALPRNALGLFGMLITMLGMVVAMFVAI